MGNVIKGSLTGITKTAVFHGVGMSLQPYITVAKDMERFFKGIGMDAIGFNLLVVRYQPYLRQIADACRDIFKKNSMIGYDLKLMVCIVIYCLTFLNKL